ncbi:hypothetical protein HXX76_000233 [Chlamydomonas incerta]|uniref:FPL domain-containing protein n=1 Tax=Chlamydomonas incerta TaxID=51695 RepID=A0A835WE00_CHLIN|nr:hypothetical protein HXX76_000233 [Chlamydomonas incerta]|eukprot:KAG2445623.1 hypothetical protein HXX76_000233 [Chlamydomonas incerta]
MFSQFLNQVRQSLFTGPAGNSNRKFTLEELRALMDVLNKNQVVTEANRALVVETIRSIAEFMIWGDQNEPRIFDFFLENNIMHYLHRVLQQPANRTGDVAKQVLQTLSIIIQNIRSETGTYFLFSNNHINNIVEIRFDFDDEEVLGYYISFLKTISMKLNQSTVQFFFDRRETTYTFPLYSEAVKFAHHKEGMVRAGVRTLTLNVYSVPDADIQDYVARPPATAYFGELASYIADQVKILDKRMLAAEGFSAQVLSSLDSEIAEVEDMVSYVSDILSTAPPRLAHLVAETLWVSLVGPYLLRSVLEYGGGRGAGSPRASGGGVAQGAGRSGRQSGGGGAPGSPAYPGGTPPPVRVSCSLYVIERLFVLITYQPLLHNLALALLDPRPGYPSCRPAVAALLRGADHRAVPAALRCLVALVHNRHAAPDILALLGLAPRSRAADLHSACSAASCKACRLQEALTPMPAGAPAAGVGPDPLAEAAQPVVTSTAGPGAPPASGVAFGYHTFWSHIDPLAPPRPPPAPLLLASPSKSAGGDAGSGAAAGSDDGAAGGPGAAPAAAGGLEVDLLGLDLHDGAGPSGSGASGLDGVGRGNSVTASQPSATAGAGPGSPAPVLLHLTAESPLQYSPADPAGPGPASAGSADAAAGDSPSAAAAVPPLADLLSLDSPDRSQPGPLPPPPPAPPPPPPAPPPPPLPDSPRAEGDLLSLDSPGASAAPAAAGADEDEDSPAASAAQPAAAASQPPAAPAPAPAAAAPQPPRPQSLAQLPPGSQIDLLGMDDPMLPAAVAATAATTANITAVNSDAPSPSGSESPRSSASASAGYAPSASAPSGSAHGRLPHGGLLAPANTLASAMEAIAASGADAGAGAAASAAAAAGSSGAARRPGPAAASGGASAADLLDLGLETAAPSTSAPAVASAPGTHAAPEPAAAAPRSSLEALRAPAPSGASVSSAAAAGASGAAPSAHGAGAVDDLLGHPLETGAKQAAPPPAAAPAAGGLAAGPGSGGPLAGLMDVFPQAAAAAAAVAATALKSTTAALVDHHPLGAAPAPAPAPSSSEQAAAATAQKPPPPPAPAPAPAAHEQQAAPEPIATPEPAPAPAPAPPAPASPPRPRGPPCASHARPAAVAVAGADILDALFGLLPVGLLPVPALWNVALLLNHLYPRAEEQRALERELQAPPQAAGGADLADLLGAGSDGSDAEAAGAGAAGAGAGAGASSEPADTHPLHPASTATWACALTAEQREALRVAAVSAASAVLDEVGGMWTDALVSMMALEWPAAYEGVTRPNLRTGAENLIAGPHLYPRQTGRGLSSISGRNDQGLSGSAVAALHCYHAVCRLVALLHLHNVLATGATSRRPPPACPLPPNGDVELREWDVMEGQEVELQAGSAISCIVSFSPGQERRVYFAAAGPSLRRELQDAQALLADPNAQAVVLHSSPAVVLADPAPTRLNAGIALSVAPLLGCDPKVDGNVPKWLHVHVRPSVRGLLRLLRSAAGGRKGGLLGALRHLVDGHWVLAFPDVERAGNARSMVEQAAHKLRALYCELLSPLLGAVME